MSKLSVLNRVGKHITNPLFKAFSILQNVVPVQLGDTESDRLNKRILQLFVWVIRVDDQVKESEIEALTALARDFYGQHLTNDLEPLLEQEDLPDLEEICDDLKVLGMPERQALLRGLFVICFSDNDFCIQEQECMIRIAQLLEISNEQVEVEEKKALQDHNQRLRILNSSTGLIAAFVVIVIFILAASFLRSVFFGLILAYFFLPLQEAILSSFVNNGLAAKGIRLINAIFVDPFVAVSDWVKNKFGSGVSKDSKASDEKAVQTAIARSCHATVMFVSSVFVLVCAGFIGFTALKYQEISLEALQQDLFLSMEKIKSMPLFNQIYTQISVQETPEFHDVEKPLLQIGHFLLEYLFSILSSVGHLFLNAFMSLFFFSFFLNRMAEFQHEQESQTSVGDYLVRSLFQSSWLPNTSYETTKGATDIINQIFFMLKTWVRGYMWIILIEVPIYCLFFAVLGIPYPLILGIIAGLTVLLPFLGPIISFMLTCIVGLMFFEALTFGSMTFLYVLVIYFILHSIVEQLFLYPALVGEALGLNVLETLIVVLLGGVFSGITGMILAVPVASILKFLIPRIYRSQLSFQDLSFPSLKSTENSTALNPQTSEE